MKNLIPFLAGMLTVLAIVAVLWHFLLQAPPRSSAPKISVPSGPAPPQGRKVFTNFPVRGDRESGGDVGKNPGVFLEGRISIPPLLRKKLEGQQKMALSLGVYLASSESWGRNLVPLASNFVNPQFPFLYRIRLAPRLTRRLTTGITQNLPVSLLIRADVCFGETGIRCGPDTFPNLEGTARVRAALPASASESANVEVPGIVLSKLQLGIDGKKCAAAGHALKGKVSITPAFGRADPKADRILIFGMPYHGSLPPFPYTSPETAPPVPASAFAERSHWGIISGLTSLKKGGEFVLPIPEKFQDRHFLLWALPCPGSEPEEDCLRRGLPVTLNRKLGEGEHPAVSLIGRGFIVGHCGMEDQEFLLHHWPADAAKAGEASVHLADPPEAIEGITY